MKIHHRGQEIELRSLEEACESFKQSVGSGEFEQLWEAIARLDESRKVSQETLNFEFNI